MQKEERGEFAIRYHYNFYNTLLTLFLIVSISYLCYQKSVRATEVPTKLKLFLDPI